MLLAFFALFPLLWMLSVSLMHPGEASALPPPLLPRAPTLENYRELFARAGMGRYLFNSLLVASAITLLSLVFNLAAGYAFAKLRFAGRDRLFQTLLGALVIPAQVAMIPLFLLMKWLHLVNSYGGVIVPAMATVFGIFLVRQYARSIPDELLEAARIDGAGEWRIFAVIVLPLLKPIVVTLAIFTFLASWNDFMWPLIVLSDQAWQTAPVALAALSREHVQDNELMMAGSVVTILPVLAALPRAAAPLPRKACCSAASRVERARRHAHRVRRPFLLDRARRDRAAAHARRLRRSFALDGARFRSGQREPARDCRPRRSARSASISISMACRLRVDEASAAPGLPCRLRARRARARQRSRQRAAVQARRREERERLVGQSRRAFRRSRGVDAIAQPQERQIDFAWGPIADRTLGSSESIEFTVYAVEGGRGEVCFADLVFRERATLPAVLPKPLASASSATRAAAAANAIDGDATTFWQSASGAEQSITVDLGIEREFGGLVLRWHDDAFASNYDVALSDDAKTWRTVRRVTAGNGGADPLYLPESEARYVRLSLHGRGGGYALDEIELKDLAFGASANAFFSTLAKSVPRGWYPRGFYDEQTYWTVVGVDGGHETGLFSEDGALEVSRGGFSIAPIVADADGHLSTWADATITHALADGYLPIPSVELARAGFRIDDDRVRDRRARRIDALRTLRARKHQRPAARPDARTRRAAVPGQSGRAVSEHPGWRQPDPRSRVRRHDAFGRRQAARVRAGAAGCRAWFAVRRGPCGRAHRTNAAIGRLDERADPRRVRGARRHRARERRPALSRHARAACFGDLRARDSARRQHHAAGIDCA